jgi:uncharacterized surface protein with fasciclin (FAS1) repeats
VKQGVTAANLVSTLSSERALSLCLANGRAFAELPKGTVETLLKPGKQNN